MTELPSSSHFTLPAIPLHPQDNIRYNQSVALLYSLLLLLLLLLLRRRRRRRRKIRLAGLDENLHIDARLGIAVLDPLPRRDAGLLGVDLEEAQAADVAVVAGVPAEADAAGVAHPHGGHLLDVVGLLLRHEGQFLLPAGQKGLCLVAVGGEGAVVVDVVAGEV